MSEWLKEHAWKACVGETLPWVRIPLSPPFNLPGLAPNRPALTVSSSHPLASPQIDSPPLERLEGVVDSMVRLQSLAGDEK